jgi:hypothetical protein
VVVIGLVLFAAALAAAMLIVQNRDSTFPVHGLGHTWEWHPYWVLVAGLSIALVGVLGVALMRAGAVYARRLRRETAKLLAERAALSPDPPWERPR